MPSLTIDIAENEHLKKLTLKIVRNATLSEHENGLNNGVIASIINSATQSHPDVHIYYTMGKPGNFYGAATHGAKCR